MLPFKKVLAKIADLKARILKDSISPHHLGSILEEMLGYCWRTGTVGNYEFDRLKAGSLELAQLIFSRYHTIDADTVFSESDIIESVTDNGDGTFSLVFSEKYPGYVTSQIENNILKGVYTDIPPQIDPDEDPQVINDPVVVTSWMNVQSIDAEHNTATVTLYPADLVPGGKNFPPVPEMSVMRWGNSGDSTDPRYAQRQEVFYISGQEHRLVKLSKVTKPGYDDGMVMVSVGTIPEFICDIDERLQYGDDGVVADTVVARRFITIDSLGRPVYQIIDRGPFKLGEKYYDGSVPNDNGIYERSMVYHNGHGWLSNYTGVATEAHIPTWRTAYWTHAVGDTRLTLEFCEPDNLVEVENPRLDVSVQARYMGETVTDSSAIYFDWERVSVRQGIEDTVSDQVWNESHANAGASLTLLAEDFNMQFGQIPDSCRIVCTARLHDPNNPNLLPDTAEYYLI